MSQLSINEHVTHQASVSHGSSLVPARVPA